MRLLADVSVEISTRDHTGQSVVELHFVGRPAADWTLGLVMLDYGLIDGLLLVDRKTGLSVSVQRDDAIANPVAAISRKAKRFNILLTETELGAWIAFFLKYHRDGFAEVDHMDVEAHPVGGSGNGTTIVVKVDDAAPPLSQDELRKKLGL